MQKVRAYNILSAVNTNTKQFRKKKIIYTLKVNLALIT